MEHAKVVNYNASLEDLFGVSRDVSPDILFVCIRDISLHYWCCSKNSAKCYIANYVF